VRKIIFILPLVLVGTGTFLLSIDGLFLKVAGVLLFFIGTYWSYQIQSKNTSSDKQEIISRIENFKNELEQIKSTAQPEIQNQIIEIENEFDNWAKEFKENRELKKIELQSREIDLEKFKWSLSKTYRPFYVEFVEIIDKLVESYNQNNKIKIEITHNYPVPANLFLGEAVTFRKVIKFPKKYFWIVSFSIEEPIDEDKIPDINVSVDIEEKFYAPSSFSIWFRVKEKKVSFIKRNFFDKVKLENTKSSFENFGVSTTQNLKILFEYQLLNSE
jgi:hypothetical protein